MEARLLPMGRAALLVEVADTDEALALRGRLSPLVGGAEGVWGDVDHLVVGARTLLVRLRTGGRLAEVGRACAAEAAAVDPAALERSDVVVEIPVRYDGPDLGEVASLTGLTREQVVQAHTGTTWRVGFGGFAPGFAYLVDGDPRLEVPRRSEPRTRVPAGSVALAGRFSGVYPQDSPGGWQLVGSTDVVLWDADRDPPALLAPGQSVRFTDAGPVTAAAIEHAHPAPEPPDRPGSRPGRGLEVLATGPLTLVEDLGRPHLADAGVGRSGAADPTAYLLGLRLVGHVVDDREIASTAVLPASLEVTLGGLVVRARGELLVALTGAACPADVDGRPVGHAAPIVLRDGQVLTLGTPTAGLRTWLAVRGGIVVPPVLGSRSTDTLSRLGPPAPVVGDVLAVGPTPATFPVVEAAPQPDAAAGEVVLELDAGPRGEWCDLSDLQGRWTVSPRSNRVGIRLEGSRIHWSSTYADRELPSEGLVPGAVQVPPGGEPVVFLADHPVTGGYPVVAVLTPVSVSRAAQLRPGQAVRLRWAPRR
ncbi:5-oxoprolinase/urea amidolyase family protein [Terrabacter aerolatus]|uniref:Allophanate hydrolase n=1 Tax=Terrabacter aerolatus TaxID=422442 RepID=A0A512D2A8_9MICO|nr:urea amidolyase family protein [Terrabacter aerolatus]GEO30601.1 allophanate hydrolase [Terrabacter aerolatus]